MFGAAVQCRSGNSARGVQQAKLCHVTVVDEGPCRVAKCLVVGGFIMSQQIHEDTVGLIDGEVEAKHLEKDVFLKQYTISPAPEILGLFVDKQVRVLLRDAAAGDNKVLYLAT